MNALWASADSVIVQIPNFAGRLQKVVDSFISLQYTLRFSLSFQNLAYSFAPDKTA